MIKEGYIRYKGNTEKIICVIYCVIALFCCFFTLRILNEQILRGLRAVYYVLCLYSLIKLNYNRSVIAKTFQKPWQKAFVLLLELYCTFAMTGMYILPSSVGYAVDISEIVFMVFSFIWVRAIALQGLAFLVTIPEKVVLSENTVKIKTRLLLLIIVVLPCLFFLAGFNPAITSWDSEYCFLKAHELWQAGFSMPDWHPPFYVFVLNLLLKIHDSVSFIIVIQIIWFAVVFVDGILFLYQCGLSKKLIGIFYLFITFGISNIIQLITLWKDIPYMISLMWLTLLLIKFIVLKDEQAISCGWYLQFIIAIIFTAFFRQNGILPALAVVILLPVAMKFSKRIVVTSVICLFLMAIVKVPLYKTINVISVPQLKYFSLANDMMYSYYHGHEVSDDVMEIVNKITNNAPEKFSYNAYYVEYNENEPSGYSIVEFMTIYGRAFIQNPADMMIALLTRNSVMWSIASPYNELQSCINYLGEENTHLPKLYPDRNQNIVTSNLTNFCNWVKSNTLLYVIYWRTGIYNLLIIFMGIILFCDRGKNRLRQLMPFIPITMNLAGLFITSGWGDYRYYWPAMTISFFLFFYFTYIRSGRQAEPDVINEYS